MSSGNYVSVNGNLTDLYRPLTDILGLLYDETMTYEERVQKRYDYVKEQLEKDPNYEGWDWVEYRPYSKKYIGIEFPLLRSFTAMISTKGKIAKQKFNTHEIIVTIGNFVGRYLREYIRFDSKSTTVYIHRAMGCTFIPKPERHKNIFYVDLICKHKNPKNVHNNFYNLEWVNPNESLGCVLKNNKLQHHNKEMSRWGIVGLCIIENEFMGKYLVFNSKQEIKKSKLDPIVIYQVIRGETENAYGCKWSKLPKSEFPAHCYELLQHVVNLNK